MLAKLFRLLFKFHGSVDGITSVLRIETVAVFRSCLSPESELIIAHCYQTGFFSVHTCNLCLYFVLFISLHDCSKPPYDGPSPTSISEVADKTVSSLNIHKAIANDTSKRDGKLKC